MEPFVGAIKRIEADGSITWTCAEQLSAQGEAVPSSGVIDLRAFAPSHEDSLEGQVGQPDPATEAPVKRGRGRPRKVPE